MNTQLVKQKERNEKFTQIYSEYFPYVCNIIRLHIFDENAVEDIAQDVFLVVYQKLHTITSVKNYIQTVVRLKLKKYYRDTKRHDDLVEIIQDEADQDFAILLNDAIYTVIENETELCILQKACMAGEMITHIASSMKTTRKKVQYTLEKLIKKIRNYFRTIGIYDICEAVW